MVLSVFLKSTLIRAVTHNTSLKCYRITSTESGGT